MPKPAFDKMFGVPLSSPEWLIEETGFGLDQQHIQETLFTLGNGFIGSPNSERIAPSIMQVLLRLRNHSPLDAVAAPRLHCSVGGSISLEAARMLSYILELLRKRGFDVVEREPFSFYHGCVQLVLRVGNEFIGVADPRRDDSAAGPASPPPHSSRGA